MRIMHWMPRYHPDVGGVEVLARHLLPALARRGYEQAVISVHGDFVVPDRTEVDGIPVLRVHLARFMQNRDLGEMLRMRMAMTAFYKAFKPTLDHVHWAGPATFLYTLAPATAPMLCTLHSVVAEMPHGPETTTQRLLSGARWVTGVSQATLDEGRAWWPAIEDRCSVVMNGLVPHAAPPLPYPDGPAHVVAAGRLVAEKGFDVIIDALAQLPDVRLTIAGDGPMRPLLEERARPYGSRVVFPGWVSQADLPALMGSAHVVAVPSRWQEPFCLVALEAALAARPVVASRAGGLPEVVLDGTTGLIVPMDDVTAMAQAIDALLRDPTRAAAFGATARDRALTEFTLGRCVDAYDTLYRRVAND